MQSHVAVLPIKPCTLHLNMQWQSCDPFCRLRAALFHPFDAMQVKSLPKAFEEVVKTHFRLNQDRILETCKVWADEGGSKDSKLLAEIRSELQKL